MLDGVAELFLGLLLLHVPVLFLDTHGCGDLMESIAGAMSDFLEDLGTDGLSRCAIVSHAVLDALDRFVSQMVVLNFLGLPGRGSQFDLFYNFLSNRV